MNTSSSLNGNPYYSYVIVIVILNPGFRVNMKCFKKNMFTHVPPLLLFMAKTSKRFSFSRINSACHMFHVNSPNGIQRLW